MSFPVPMVLPLRFQGRQRTHREARGPVSKQKKCIMETERNPKEPIKPPAPGQQGGGQQGDRDKEKEREREKQGGGGQQGGGREQGGGQQGGGQQSGR